MTDTTQSTPKVSLIILNWNQKDITLECLKSVHKITYPNYQIIIVDNGSEDNSVSAIKNSFPEIKVIDNKSNLGVAGGRNVGIEYARQNNPDYLLLLDNDTIVNKDFITEMVNVAENDHQVGILTGKIYFYSHPNKIWSAGGSLSLYRCNFSLIGYGEMDVGQYDTVKDVDHVTGSCLMIRNKVIDKIGVLDNNFNPYFGEDTDWCLRTKKEGYKITYVPKAKLWHHVIIKTTVNNKYWYLKGRNLLLFMRKHAQAHHWVVFSFFFVAGSLKVLYRESKAGNLRNFYTMAKGALHAFGRR